MHCESNLICGCHLPLYSCTIMPDLETFFSVSLKDITVKLSRSRVVESRAFCSMSTFEATYKGARKFFIIVYIMLCTYVSFRMTLMKDCILLHSIPLTRIKSISLICSKILILM